MEKICECVIPTRNLYQNICRKCGGKVLVQDGSGGILFTNEKANQEIHSTEKSE